MAFVLSSEAAAGRHETALFLGLLARYCIDITSYASYTFRTRYLLS